MTISSKSWHYRLHCFVFTFFNWECYGVFDALRGPNHWWAHKPYSLCGYFWSTVILTILFPIIGLLLIVLTIVFGPLVAVALGIHWVYEIYREHRPKQGPSRTGLLAHYVAARKRKVCPLITVDFGKDSSGTI